MTFSLLIAHYNNHIYFKDCYQSLKDQSYPEFEIIILDDASEKESFNEIKKLTAGDSKVKIYENPENKGVGYTKKRLIELASGQICGFVDPDDALTDDALATVLMAYQKKGGIVGTYSQLLLCDKNLKIQEKFANSYQVKSGNSLFFNIFFEVSHFFTFKRESYFKTDGIDSRLEIGEDIDLYLKLYEIGKLHFIKKPLYLYRVHTSGLSHDTEKTKLKNESWHKVLVQTLKRRKISKLYAKNIDDIAFLPSFLRTHQNTFWVRLGRKFRY